MQILALFLAALVSALLPQAASAAAPKASDLVRVELVAEPQAVAAGKPFTVGIRLDMAEHWHTYWRNPGDSGLATEIAWSLPAGWTAGPIQWPTPHRIPIGPLVNYGYETETTLLVELRPPADLPAGRTIELRGRVSYLVCERECIPGEADVSTALPVAGDPVGATPDPATRYIFDAARTAEPKASPWPVRLEAAGDKLTLRVEASGLKGDAIAGAYFFPVSETAIDHAAPQPLIVDASGLALTLQRSNLATGAPPAALSGVLVLDEKLGDGALSRQAFQIGPDEPAPAAGASSSGDAARPRPIEPLSAALLLNAVLLAFLGGLVLNLMPCVFPVLSIKVLSLVKHSGASRTAIRLSGLAYGAGVVASFLALAAILLAVRAGGQEVGWGFQLQSPAVVAALAFLMLAMGLSLSGLFEFGASVSVLAGRADQGGSGLGGSFGTGVLAAAVATPCTAPFMGAAIGFALTAPAGASLAIFGALGLGMAAPFLMLTFVPGLLARMPRPGGWMSVLKQLLAFPVYATVAWLVFVLSQQVGPTGLFAALLGLVLVGFAMWLLRLSGEGRGIGRRVSQAAAIATLAGLVGIGWAVARDAATPTSSASREAGGYEPFTQARLDALRAEGRPVFVNMTAAWCITCLVNERTTLSSEAVQARLKSADVVYLKGDWTNQNPEITRLLERHGRSGVPLYVLYPARGEPVVLPQILTEATVLESLSQLPAATRRAELQPPSPTGVTR